MAKIKQKIELILASSSKAREKVLRDLGLEFKIINPDFDEEEAKKDILHLDISAQALFLARQKALSVSRLNPDSLVIGSDQICQLEKAIVSKPKNKAEAILQLQKMNGKIHFQNNGVALLQGEKDLLSYNQIAQLKMRFLTEEEIINYVDSDNPVGCAGSYKIESLGRHLFEEIEGDLACITGIAIQPLLNYLHQNQLIKL